MTFEIKILVTEGKLVMKDWTNRNMSDGRSESELPERLCHYWLSRVTLPAGVRRSLKGDAPAIRALFNRNPGQFTIQRLERELAGCLKQGIQVLLPGDGLYELIFGAMGENGINIPYILYLKGDPSLLMKRGVAFVGSRKAGSYGKRATEELVRSLRTEDVVIVSGGARGIDTAAHLTALDHGLPTIAVLGSGIGWDYPPENRGLFQRISEEGLLVSEYEPGRKPEKYFFPERNRIIAQLAEAVVVTAAARTSGALHTAEHAMDSGHTIFTIPYELFDEAGEGCRLLVETGAELILHCELFSEMIS